MCEEVWFCYEVKIPKKGNTQSLIFGFTTVSSNEWNHNEVSSLGSYFQRILPYESYDASRIDLALADLAGMTMA